MPGAAKLDPCDKRYDEIGELLITVLLHLISSQTESKTKIGKPLQRLNKSRVTKQNLNIEHLLSKKIIKIQWLKASYSSQMNYFFNLRESFLSFITAINGE
jgi:hypothetical protein